MDLIKYDQEIPLLMYHDVKIFDVYNKLTVPKMLFERNILTKRIPQFPLVPEEDKKSKLLKIKISKIDYNFVQLCIKNTSVSQYFTEKKKLFNSLPQFTFDCIFAYLDTLP